MIDKAFGLQEAVRKAVYDDETKYLASNIFHNHMNMTEEEMANAMFNLLGHLASQASFETVLVLLDEDQQGELANTIDMLQGMGNE